jgi:hypothetical protein
MNKEKLTWLVVGVAVGLIAAPQLKRLPLVSKLPTVR